MSFQERLFRAMCDAYSIETLEQMVGFRLNQRLDRIAGRAGRIDTIVFQLIQWADQNARMSELVKGAAEYVETREDLAALKAECQATPEQSVRRPDGASPQGNAALPDVLAALIQAYERIPAFFPDESAGWAMMAETAAKMRALPLQDHPLPAGLHLSESAGARLAAVLTLERCPDPAYLRWLSERVVVENTFTGYRAALALTYAALLFDMGALARLRTQVKDGADRLSAARDKARARSQLQEALNVIERRLGMMGRQSAVAFDEIASAIVESFNLESLRDLVRSHIGLPIEMIVGLDYRIEYIVFHLLEAADRAGWDDRLVQAAYAACPGSPKLAGLFAKYANAPGAAGGRP
jgi:hypothetical protein